MRVTHTGNRVAITAAAVAAVAWSAAASAAVKYWDLNGVTDGAGGPAPAGTWDLSASNWNTDPLGGAAGTVGAFVANDDAVFSAGGDATGAFTLDLPANVAATNVTFEEGTVSIIGTTALNHSGLLTINAPATLVINSTSRLGGTGNVYLNGGKLSQANATSGGSFIATAKQIVLGATGGTVEYTTGGTASSLYAGTIIKDTTLPAGTVVTLRKTGAGEFRYQNTGTANTTFDKLFVEGGLFRLGSVTTGTPAVQQTSELGFGAAPATVTTDAITLNGGGIGASFGVTLNTNRGVTIGPNGGTLNGSAAGLTIPSPVSGSGTLIVVGTNGVTLSNTGNVTTFTGALQDDGLLTLSQSLTVTNLSSTVTAGTVAVAAGKVLTAGGDGTSTTYVGRITGAGSFTKVGAGTLTMSPTAGEWTNTGGVNISAGTIKFGTSAAGFAATVPVTIAAGAVLDMNAINDSFGSLSGAGRVVGAANGAVVSNLTLSATTGTATFSGTLEQSGTFTKSAAATQVLSGTATNTYGGITTILGGTLALNKTAGVTAVPTNVVFGSTTAVGGTVQLQQANQIADTASVTFSNVSGVLNANGLSETLGTLSLVRLSAPTTNAAIVANGTLDFGAGASAVVRFAASSGLTWDPVGTLTVQNWDGVVDVGGGTEQLFVGTDGTGLTATQAGQIKFIVPGAPNGFYYGAILPTGEVVASTTAVPEPSAAAGLLAAAGAARMFRRRRRAATVGTLG